MVGVLSGAVFSGVQAPRGLRPPWGLVLPAVVRCHTTGLSGCFPDERSVGLAAKGRAALVALERHQPENERSVGLTSKASAALVALERLLKENLQ